MAEIGKFQNRGSMTYIHRFGFEIGNAVYGQWCFFAGIWQVVILVGRRVGRRECARLTCGERNALNSRYRCIKHACTYFFTIHKNCYTSVFDRKLRFDFVCFIGLIFHQIAVTSSSFSTYNAIGHKFNARAGNAFIIQKLDTE